MFSSDSAERASNTAPQKTGNSPAVAGLDYLAFSFRLDTSYGTDSLEAFVRFFLPSHINPTEEFLGPSGWLRYRYSDSLYYDCNYALSKARFQWGSAALNNFDLPLQHDLLSFLVEAVEDSWCTVSRVDVRADTDAFTVDDAYQWCKEGKLVTHSKKYSYLQSGEVVAAGGGLAQTGTTLYIGSRSSTTFTRIYDQTFKQDSSLPTRVEVEHKGVLALSLSKQLINSPISDWGQLIAGCLIRAVDFRHRVAGQPNPNRCPRLEAYELFVSGAAKAILYVLRPTPTLERVVNWFSRNCVQAMALIAISAGSDNSQVDISSVLESYYFAGLSRLTGSASRYRHLLPLPVAC